MIVLAARSLGVESFGQFSSLIAIVGIISTFTNLGVDPIIFRQVSKFPNNFNLIRTGITLRIIAFLILVVLYNIIAFIINIPETEIILTNILLLNILFSSKLLIFRETLTIPFKVHLKMHYPIIIILVDYLLLMIGTIILIIVGIDVFWFVIVYTFSALPGSVLIYFILNKKFGVTYKPSLAKWKYLINQSMPIFGTVFLSAVFSQLDIILLKYFESDYSAGIYTASSRLTTPLIIIPTAIITTVFPIIVKKIRDNKDSNIISNLVFKILFLISFTMALFIFFQADLITNFVYGVKYSDSADSTTILFFSQIILFFNFYSINLLIAKNRQKDTFTYSFVLVVGNILFNWVLINFWSINGAAAAKLISAFIGLVFLLYFQNKCGFKFNIDWKKLMLWIVLMMISFYCISLTNTVIFWIFIPILLFILTIYLKYFSEYEIRLLFQIIGKEKLGEKFIQKTGIWK